MFSGNVQGVCRYYESLRVWVVMRATLVNTQTDRQVLIGAQPAELKTHT